jgi:hypothetical protein
VPFGPVGSGQPARGSSGTSGCGCRSITDAKEALMLREVECCIRTCDRVTVNVVPGFPPIRAECHETEPSIRRSDRPTALPAERADDGLTSEGRSHERRGHGGKWIWVGPRYRDPSIRQLGWCTALGRAESDVDPDRRDRDRSRELTLLLRWLGLDGHSAGAQLVSGSWRPRVSSC